MSPVPRMLTERQGPFSPQVMQFLHEFVNTVCTADSSAVFIWHPAARPACSLCNIPIQKNSKGGARSSRKCTHFSTCVVCESSLLHWFFFNLPNPSSRTMALRLTQPLTETCTRNLPVDKARPARKTDLTAVCLESAGASTSPNPMGLHSLLRGQFYFL
jgi:hypothetical protein